jgi:uncharacterized protein YndB with AHSA1/START domain
VVGSLRPMFRLAKLEGDAAFVYVLAESIDGSMLQDQIERCYFSFRRRLRDIRQASTCDCNACILIPNLNLKFVAHHGSVARQRIAGWEELVGSDVVVVHRLLKNSVGERLGLDAYAFYTQACIDAMGADPVVLGMMEHRETYEFLGETVGWVRDLEAAWVAEQEQRRVIVAAKDAGWTFERTLDAPRELVWSYLTSPLRRQQWQAGVTAVREMTATGRRGVGTTNHCVHGKDVIVEEVLDWRPYDYVTTRFQLPMPGVPKMMESDVLEDADGGTRLIFRFQKVRSAKDRQLFEGFVPMLEESIAAGVDALIPLLEAEMAARTAAAVDVPEPPVPKPSGRILEPVRT